MPRQNGSSRPSLGAWQTESLRLTGFRLEADSEQDLNLWQQVVGEEPESRTRKPKTSEQLDFGPFGEGKLILQIQLGRIDWV